MTPIRKNIMDLKKCLYRLLDGPIETARQSTEIDQSISIDPETAEALAKNAKGDINIFNSATVNVQIVSESSKALKFLDLIDAKLRDPTYNFDSIIYALFLKGWTADEIETFVRRKVYDLAIKSTKNTSCAARMLGIGRTTFIDRRNKQRRIDDKKTLFEAEHE